MSLTPYVHVDVSIRAATRGDEIPLASHEDHHLRRVLRLPDGAEIEVADGVGGHAHATLAGQRLVLRTDAEAVPAPTPRLVLAQALGKGRKLDEVVRVATELGVEEIVPVAATRSVRVLSDERAARTAARWAAIARAAAEQARRPTRPTIAGVATSLATLAPLAEDGLLLVAHPGAPPLPDQLEQHLDVAQVVVVIGPEGGFDDVEVAELVRAGALAAGLGPWVLRTEHAGAAALAAVAAATGRWG